MADREAPPATLASAAEHRLAWERERLAFWQMKEPLLDEYAGRYVAIHEGRVVDSDENEAVLAERVYRQCGYVPVYVQLVTPGPLPTRRVDHPRKDGMTVEIEGA